MSVMKDDKPEPCDASALSLVAIFLAGAVGYGLWTKQAADAKQAAFVRRCPNAPIESLALRTPEGRIVIIGIAEIPERHMAAICPDPAETARRLGLSSP